MEFTDVTKRRESDPTCGPVGSWFLLRFCEGVGLSVSRPLGLLTLLVPHVSVLINSQFFHNFYTILLPSDPLSAPIPGLLFISGHLIGSAGLGHQPASGPPNLLTSKVVFIIDYLTWKVPTQGKENCSVFHGISILLFDYIYLNPKLMLIPPRKKASSYIKFYCLTNIPNFKLILCVSESMINLVTEMNKTKLF